MRAGFLPVSRRATTLEIVFAVAGGVLLFFLVAPVATALFSNTPSSLWDTLRDREVLSSIRLTFGAALAAVVLGLLTGVPLAYLLARRSFPGRGLVQAVVSLPIVIPHTAAGIALLLVFGRRGFLGMPLGRLGLVFTDSVPGIVVAMSFVGLPFLVTAARDAFASIEEEYELAALADGASRWQAFSRVALPLAWPGVLSGALMLVAVLLSQSRGAILLGLPAAVIAMLVVWRGRRAAIPVMAALGAMAAPWIVSFLIAALRPPAPAAQSRRSFVRVRPGELARLENADDPELAVVSGFAKNAAFAHARDRVRQPLAEAGTVGGMSALIPRQRPTRRGALKNAMFGIAQLPVRKPA